MAHRNHLGSQRKRWKLSSQELADLLGYRYRSAPCRFEKSERPPTIRLALACEVVFGQSARELFPGLYAAIEDKVMQRAAKLDKTLRDDVSRSADVKRELLRQMTKRATKRRRA